MQTSSVPSNPPSSFSPPENIANNDNPVYKYVASPVIKTIGTFFSMIKNHPFYSTGIGCCVLVAFINPQIALLYGISITIIFLTYCRRQSKKSTNPFDKFINELTKKTFSPVTADTITDEEELIIADLFHFLLVKGFDQELTINLHETLKDRYIRVLNGGGRLIVIPIIHKDALPYYQLLRKNQKEAAQDYKTQHPQVEYRYFEKYLIQQYIQRGRNGESTLSPHPCRIKDFFKSDLVYDPDAVQEIKKILKNLDINSQFIEGYTKINEIFQQIWQEKAPDS